MSTRKEHLLEKLTTLRRLRDELTAARTEACKIRHLERSTEELAKEVVALLDGADLLARGNMGWEGRVIQFLLELTNPQGALS